MKKKRLFIAAHYMEIGGAEISLIGLLQAIDYSRYDVDLFVYSHVGELMDLIPKEVNVLPEISSYASIEKPLKDVLFSKNWLVGLARLYSKWQFYKYQKKNYSSDSFVCFQYLENNLYKVLPSLYKYGEYDLALNFIADTAMVLDKVKAKKTVTWIHSDYSSFAVEPSLSLPLYNRVDYIASISADASYAFLDIYPSLKDKIIEIENILSPIFVRDRAENGSADDMVRKDGETCLLSIGRFCTAKNYDNVPLILKEIRQMGIKAKWYIIGYGGDEPLIRQKIDEAGMQEYVIILGKKENPYPYIKACDWYVQPSRYEGKSVTVREAQMLCKPVVVTNYPTASSQVQSGIDGVIVPIDNDGCAQGLAKVIMDNALQQQIVDYLKTHDYGNEKEVEKIYQLIN